MSTALVSPSHAAVSQDGQLTGRRKVAIVCLAVGAEAAGRLTAELTPDEAALLTYEIAQMEQVSPEVTESVLNEWLEAVLGVTALTGGLQYAREVLERAYGPEHAEAMLRRIQERIDDSTGLHRLRQADPQQLATTLRSEHPQTVALVLAHLEPAQTAAVLRELPTGVASDVVYRMARMEKVAPEMLQIIERTLSSGSGLSFSQGLSAAGGPATVAGVLNLLSKSLEQELLEGVSGRDAALCDQIKNLMFVFEDLISLDTKSLQRLLQEVSARELALALKAASDELKAKITGAMSQRAVAALKDEMDALGPARMRDVEAAQAAIIAQVRTLEETGEVVRNTGGDDVLV